jgi:hypothetical protein
LLPSTGSILKKSGRSRIVRNVKAVEAEPIEASPSYAYDIGTPHARSALAHSLRGPRLWSARALRSRWTKHTKHTKHCRPFKKKIRDMLPDPYDKIAKSL